MLRRIPMNQSIIPYSYSNGPFGPLTYLMQIIDIQDLGLKSQSKVLFLGQPSWFYVAEDSMSNEN